MAYEAGGFPGSAVGAGAACILGPYNIANITIDAFDVVVNKPKSSAYRAPGSLNAAFASESVIDELAERIGMDPLKRCASRTQHAKALVALTARYTRELDAKKRFRLHQIPSITRANYEGIHRGRGVASGFWFNGGGESSAAISVNSNGTLNLQEGSVDIGGSRASMSMIVAETLGLNADDINPSIPDTSSIGMTAGTGGSRVTYATGHACYKAAEDVKAEMSLRAARQLEVDESDIEYQEGRFVCKSDTSKSLSLKK